MGWWGLDCRWEGRESLGWLLGVAAGGLGACVGVLRRQGLPGSVLTPPSWGAGGGGVIEATKQVWVFG